MLIKPNQFYFTPFKSGRLGKMAAPCSQSRRRSRASLVSGQIASKNKRETVSKDTAGSAGFSLFRGNGGFVSRHVRSKNREERNHACGLFLVQQAALGSEPMATWVTGRATEWARGHCAVQCSRLNKGFQVTCWKLGEIESRSFCKHGPLLRCANARTRQHRNTKCPQLNTR